MAGDSQPNYVRFELGAHGEFCFPPATHFIATVKNSTDVLNWGSEDIDSSDGDADKEQGQDHPFTRSWTATSSYDVYMVDTPKDSNTGTGGNNTPDDAEHNENPIGAKSEQEEQENGQASPNEQALPSDNSEDDNYLSLSEDEVSLGDEDFIVPKGPLEHEHFKRRLIATARSLKKK